MDYAQALWLYTLLVFGIIVVPGMDMVFVLASALSGGRRAGLSATFGIMAGGLVHTLYAALGVGMLLHFAPKLFNALLVLGAVEPGKRKPSTVSATKALSATPMLGRKSR